MTGSTRSGTSSQSPISPTASVLCVMFADLERQGDERDLAAQLRDRLPE